MDFIHNGHASGNVAATLLQTGFNVNALRPYIGDDGRHYVTTNQSGIATATPLINATATLRKDDWKILDSAIVKAAKPRLKAVADLRSMGLQYTIPNGMGKTVLETETQSDITAASITMDGLENGPGDRPVFELSNMPLPIIHKDFSFTARQLAASRNGNSPLDTTTAELASRRVAEIAERLLIGDDTLGCAFGGGNIYGYTNYDSSIAATITSPVASGWTAADTVSEVLGMVQSSMDAYHYGPWYLYYGPSWSRYMNDEYKAYSDDTLADRLRRIDNISDVKVLDYLTGYDLILVQMTSDVVREVVGMDITTVQWESNGGMKINFKVMAIMLPQLRADQNSNTGIVHGTV